ncbi:hypothetical protein [Palleronia sp. LCG004]|uniref:hypothetical protein n=1 Tax=Palleronia sp. LCG004 TaxID=3079304 RepID=UPI0029422781|nr:hypothetical protein [Palleronia sp. LCG004]WOI57917.1 hypothetical protein RVY76_15025 [Palleronia sp. LCG004]
MVAFQGFHQEFGARSETTYEGQRTDGTHAVNGQIYLENRLSDFQCSYNSAGDTMVRLYADGQSWPDIARAGDSPYFDDAVGSASEPPASDAAAEVQFERGNYGTMLEGAIVGRNYFDYSLTANQGQTL